MIVTSVVKELTVNQIQLNSPKLPFFRKNTYYLEVLCRPIPKFDLQSQSFTNKVTKYPNVVQMQTIVVDSNWDLYSEISELYQFVSGLISLKSH